MTMLTQFTITFINCCVIALALTSCISPKKSKIDTSKEIIMSKKEINDFAKNEIKTNGKFRWEAASDHLIYSALMHTDDKMLNITYTITPSGPKLPHYEEGSNKLPKEWLKKRDEIIQYILEKERIYRDKSKLTINDLLPSWNANLDNHLPSIYLQVTDPSIISELREDKTILGIAPSYEPSIHILYEK